jgi:chromosomal replication initiator protein
MGRLRLGQAIGCGSSFLSVDNFAARLLRSRPLGFDVAFRFMSLIATSLTASEVWSRLLERAKQALPEQTYRTWLEPAEALSLEEKSDTPNGTGPTATLVVSAPDQFAADWNESKYAHLLASYAPVAVGHPITVVFRVSEERKARPQMDLFVAPAPEEEAAAKRQAGAINAALTPRYTFDHFVAGKSNELAFAAAQAVSQGPGKFYNPLFVYGATGLGKTHLMQAVAHDVLARFPNTRITLVGTEQFTNEMIQAIQTRTNHDFRRRYRETDMLLVDDVHFLKGKEATQEEFFHTFNALYEAGRQIILTSDRHDSSVDSSGAWSRTSMCRTWSIASRSYGTRPSSTTWRRRSPRM